MTACSRRHSAPSAAANMFAAAETGERIDADSGATSPLAKGAVRAPFEDPVPWFRG
jgi:hypothetical protein